MASQTMTQQSHRVNVGKTERNASMIGGAALAAVGIAGLAKKRFTPSVALAALGGYMIYRGKSGHCSLYQSFGVNTAQREGQQFIDKSITINKSPYEVYEYWRDLGNLPRFMQGIESVTMTSDRISHWVARGPGNVRVEWDAETVEDVPGQRISWRSLESSEIGNEGTISFNEAPAGRGTELKVHMGYFPSRGVASTVKTQVAKMVTPRQIEEDLKRFKQVVETGEISTASTLQEAFH